MNTVSLSGAAYIGKDQHEYYSVL